jgi:hypothetical protein
MPNSVQQRVRKPSENNCLGSDRAEDAYSEKILCGFKLTGNAYVRLGHLRTFCLPRVMSAYIQTQCVAIAQIFDDSCRHNVYATGSGSGMYLAEDNCSGVSFQSWVERHL